MLITYIFWSISKYKHTLQTLIKAEGAIHEDI